MRAHLLLAVLTTFALPGCSSSMSEPTAISEGPSRSPNQSTAAERWMVVTRDIMGRREFVIPVGWPRSYALVAVAQYNAAVAAGNAPVSGKRPSEAAAVSSASAAVLSALYPAEQGVIDAQVAADAAYFPSFPGQAAFDYASGATIGRTVASALVARAATDRSNAAFTGTIPTGPGFWVNNPPPQPLTPLLGESRTWFLTSGSQFRPAPPPAFNSATFLSAIADVKSAANNLTPAQLKIAQFWQGGSGPAGPMGYFTELVTASIDSAHLNERQSARVYALLHTAIMDAVIACWDGKYTYWYVRPYQADPTISTPVGRPPFPSYPSAHSCVAGAAAGIIAGLFPSMKPVMDAKVAEAGVARIYAGLHYSFDITAGQELGYKVAAFVLTKVPAANVPIPLN